MEAPQGTLRYAGNWNDGAFSLLRTVSGTPDPIQCKFILGVDLPRYGDIQINYGRVSLRMANCRAVRQVIPAGTNGRFKELVFEDRRWNWRTPIINGQYNIYIKGVKSTQPSCRKNAQELVKLCFDALGEFNIDVSLVPNKVYPTTEFNGGLAIEHLENLLSQFGLAVALGFDDKARVVRIGYGRRPPNDDRVMDYSVSFEPRVIPERLVIESGQTLFQRDLPLEAVGYEVDTNEIKPITELSYRPDPLASDGGWSTCDTEKFRAITDQKLCELAKSCIWKLYRVQGVGLTQYLIPKAKGSEYPDSMWRIGLQSDDDWRILPLSSKQTPLHQEIAAQVIGFFRDGKSSQKNNYEDIPANFNANYFEGLENAGFPTEPAQIYSQGLSIDGNNGLVKFNAPVFLINRTIAAVDAEKYLPAKIILRTSFQLRDPKTCDFIRQTYVVRPSSRYVARGVTHTFRIPTLDYNVGNGVETDSNEFKQEAEFYAQKELAKYQLGDAMTVPYKGFVLDCPPDGSISSVRLERSDRGECSTTIEWQTENPVERVTYDEKLKRMNEARLLRRLENDRIAQLKEQARKGAN